MNMKIVVVFVLLLTSCVADANMNKAYNNCLQMKEAYSCSEYKLIKFLRKLRMESTTENVVQKVNETNTKNLTEKVNSLLTLLMDLIHSPSNKKSSRNTNELLASAPRSLEKLKTSLSKGKLVIENFIIQGT